jgi:phosphogluconate dehydratase
LNSEDHMNPRILDVTERIARRSADTRQAYLDHIHAAAERGPKRTTLSCSNLAHGFAACDLHDKAALKGGAKVNIAIVSSYNDMLSAHQPLERFPALIKDAVRQAGGVAQFAGGVPAMCDGVTQGQAGMELSLFSRDVIALAAAVALSHDMFDGALFLGVCDKIVPGLVMAALSFGHLPAIFVPGGPMPSGLSNSEKAKVRQLHAEGKVGRDALLEAESRSYHGPGTCTFYGTANSNQMLMEIMGLHLPGASFVSPNTPLRDALTRAAARRVTEITAMGNDYRPVGEVIDERAVVNAVVGLHATGGSTNHTIHLVAMARAAGIRLTWEDFAELSAVVPLLARIYPNGQADVNHFHAAGGMQFLIAELLDAGLLHADVRTVWGDGLEAYRDEPVMADDRLDWRPAARTSGDPSILAPVARPFDANGGLKLLKGNLGRAVIKVSAVHPDRQVIEAPAAVFDDQAELLDAFRRGELARDFVAVVRFQGPKANGMPELHKLTPTLGLLQDRGFKVALVTDGRMSGASGKVPAAIHVTPEAADRGPLAKVRSGDLIRLDVRTGRLEALVDEADWAWRTAAEPDLSRNGQGLGRELFANFRSAVTTADAGATAIAFLPERHSWTRAEADARF